MNVGQNAIREGDRPILIFAESQTCVLFEFRAIHDGGLWNGLYNGSQNPERSIAVTTTIQDRLAKV